MDWISDLQQLKNIFLSVLVAACTFSFYKSVKNNAPTSALLFLFPCHVYVINVWQFLFIICYVMLFYSFSGSKNPDITLKIAEIRTDSVGKVSAPTKHPNICNDTPVLPQWTKPWYGLFCSQLSVFSLSDRQHTGKGAACSLHRPVPLRWIHHQSWMDKGWSIVSFVRSWRNKWAHFYRSTQASGSSPLICVCVCLSVLGQSWWSGDSSVSSWSCCLQSSSSLRIRTRAADERVWRLLETWSTPLSSMKRPATYGSMWGSTFSLKSFHF